MKICMFSEAWKPIWGGGQVHTWELCKRLISNHDVSIDLYVRSLKDETGLKWPKSESHFNGKLKIIRVGAPSSFGSILPRLRWMHQASRAVKGTYDLVHAHAFLGAIPGRKIAHHLGIPFVYTVHGSTLLSPSSWNPRTWIYRAMEWWLVTKIPYDTEISVSHSLKQLSVKSKQLIVIPNGIDTSLFQPPSSPRDTSAFHLLYVGRFDPIKSIDQLINAFAIFHKTHPHATLELVGSGPLYPFLRAQVKKLRLNDVIIFSGFLEGSALRSAYHRANVLILTSTSEGLPLTLFEAWATKTPVLMTSVGDIPHYVNHKKTGYLVPPNNPDALLKGLTYLFDHPEESTQWSETAYSLVQSYDWDSMAGKTFEIYQNLVE